MVPEDLKYTREHEWVRLEGNIATIGITDFAQRQLGDIVYVETPKLGETFAQTDPFGTVESVKAVSELYSPLSGEVVAINEELTDNPELMNTDPYTDGWIIKVRASNLSELGGLMNTEAYTDYINSGEA
jgi:glycine cleavage system H protein